MSTNSDFNRTLSRIFSNPTFKDILKSGTCDYVFEKLKKYDSVLSLTPSSSVKEALQQVYVYLSRNYRNEYIYKNTIANKILLGRHNLNTTTLLSEFKVGGSIADLVLLNGTSTVYEIKTELDYPDKLRKQIDDYRKAFAKAYLVTHYSISEKYYSIIKDTSVGLLSLNNKIQLSAVKDAVIDYSFLSNDVMMKSLRKEEYSSIIKKYYGFVPAVSNIKYFTACLALSEKIDPVVFHSFMLDELKKRKPLEQEYLESNDLPIELKHICLCINPSKEEYSNLFQFLNKTI